MNISFKLHGKKSIKKLYVRLYHNKLDLPAFTNLLLTENQWDSDSQMVIDDMDVTIALQDLKSDILKQFNKDFVLGVVLDKKWLESIVKRSFMRPKSEDKLVNPDWSIYVTDFSKNWMENFADSWEVSFRKTMGKTLKGQYLKFIETLEEYEMVIGDKLQLRNLSLKDIRGFSDWLETEEYQISTIDRTIGRLRFFLNRASESDIEVSKAYKQRIYFGEEDELEGVYLDEYEISKIVKKDFSFDQELEITKDNFIIGVYTGLRISDFITNLDISNFKNGVVEIRTQKTKTKVVIPIHFEVAKVIDKNHGMLPPKQTKSDFNRLIKTVCQVVEIDEMHEGKIFDKDKKRKVKGVYNKFRLITGHTLRRSFCTNYRGKISDESLCKILGWSTSKMISVYDQTSKNKHANELDEHWNNK